MKIIQCCVLRKNNSRRQSFNLNSLFFPEIVCGFVSVLRFLQVPLPVKRLIGRLLAIHNAHTHIYHGSARMWDMQIIYGAKEIFYCISNFKPRVRRFFQQKIPNETIICTKYIVNWPNELRKCILKCFHQSHHVQHETIKAIKYFEAKEKNHRKQRHHWNPYRLPQSSKCETILYVCFG